MFHQQEDPLQLAGHPLLQIDVAEPVGRQSLGQLQRLNSRHGKSHVAVVVKTGLGYHFGILTHGHVSRASRGGFQPSKT